MIFRSPRVCFAAVWLARSSGECEVVHPGDALHGVVNSGAFEAAVVEGLSGLHAGEDVLDSVLSTAALAPDSAHALQPLRFPGSGRPTTTTSRVSASVTT